MLPQILQISAEKWPVLFKAFIFSRKIELNERKGKTLLSMFLLSCRLSKGCGSKTLRMEISPKDTYLFSGDILTSLSSAYDSHFFTKTVFASAARQSPKTPLSCRPQWRHLLGKLFFLRRFHTAITIY